VCADKHDKRFVVLRRELALFPRNVLRFISIGSVCVQSVAFYTACVLGKKKIERASIALSSISSCNVCMMFTLIVCLQDLHSTRLQ